ncbi:hypothetical protein L484_009941 [Morus notabilis]|uniref:Cytidyltransferase-like domain-containing protein n=1 Tax=Morus notabilis TaxID=981085 RepID=W9S4Q8_9ROSA|nr:hypothetical protein L484_009941 [Morus notabilis]
MADPWIRVAVDAIHASPTQCVLYLAGGASQAVGWLISVPGASNTVLEALVPYSRMSMIQLLGKIPTQFCSGKTAEEMALVAYNRALKLSRPGLPVLGVGFTGSLGSTRPKLGDHRFHLSTRTANRLWVSTVTLSKGLRTREQEDFLSSQLLLKAIVCACKVPGSFVPDLTESDVSEESEKEFSEDEELQQLIDGQICFKVYPFSSGVHNLNAERRVVLPGSFNPLHEGHLKLLDVATRNGRGTTGISGYRTVYVVHTCRFHGRILVSRYSGDYCRQYWLLSIGYRWISRLNTSFGVGYRRVSQSDTAVNADKPPLSVSQIKDRVKQFEKAGKTVIISNQPYFYKKAEIFPGSAFVIGADTAARLVHPKYYDGNYNKMLEILTGCKATGCTFLVAGRNVDGVFKVGYTFQKLVRAHSRFLPFILVFVELTVAIAWHILQVLDDLEIPEELKDMFISIPEGKFRMDISSSEIRKKLGM